MKSHFSEHYLTSRLVSGVSLWEIDDPKGDHELSFSFSHPCDNEGELTVYYRFNGVPVARSSFTIVPASLFGQSGQAVLLISRIQGEKDVHENIRIARSSIKGLDGPSVIAACLVGIAQALRLNFLLVVSAEAQVSRNDGNYGLLLRAYDQFFGSLGAEQVDKTIFRVALPPLEKSLCDVKPSNRKKVANQRAIKGAITAAAKLSFEVEVLGGRGGNTRNE